MKKIFAFRHLTSLTIFIFSFSLFIEHAIATSLDDKKLSFESGSKQVKLIELYTSQGCSSCPPAEKWLTTFENDKRLWQQIIPLSFHVDYWNYLGWDDEFSNKAYSYRQRLYGTLNDHGIYTPGFLVAGSEWRGFFSYLGRNAQLNDLLAKSETVGNLQVNLDGKQLSANFFPTTTVSDRQRYIFNVAIIGMNMTSNIESGENRGKRLEQDFVVLHQESWSTAKKQLQQDLQLPDDLKLPEKTGIVAWVSYPSHLRPIQATGGWL